MIWSVLSENKRPWLFAPNTLLAVTWPIQRHLFALNLEFWHLGPKFFTEETNIFISQQWIHSKNVQHLRPFLYQNRQFQSLHHIEPSVWRTVGEYKFLISFHCKSYTIGAQDKNIPCMGGVFHKLHAKFESRTWSVRNAELVICASFSAKALPGKTTRG